MMRGRRGHGEPADNFGTLADDNSNRSVPATVYLDLESHFTSDVLLLFCK